MVFPRGCIYTNTLIICNGAHTTQHSADSGQLYMGYFTTNGSRTSTLFSKSPKKYVRAFIKFNQHGWIWSEKHINPQGIKTLLFDTGQKIARTKNPSSQSMASNGWCSTVCPKSFNWTLSTKQLTPV